MPGGKSKRAESGGVSHLTVARGADGALDVGALPITVWAVVGLGRFFFPLERGSVLYYLADHDKN
jgi:hypothetical protein